MEPSPSVWQQSPYDCGGSKILMTGVKAPTSGKTPEQAGLDTPFFAAEIPPDARDVRLKFAEIETALDAHPAVSKAIVNVCDGRLVAYLRTATETEDPSTVAGSFERIRNYDIHRVFQIGCGDGQLLRRLAPDAECYWASDGSQTTIESLRKNFALPHLKLCHQSADDFNGLSEGYFDTVIIHSATRSFPDAATLARVLEGAVRLIVPGGRIFLADLVGSALLPVRHAAALAARAPEGTTVGQLRENLAICVSHETSLAVDPAWFDHLTARITDLGPVEILLRRGTGGNIDSRHRYDAILHKLPHRRLHPLPSAVAWANLNLEQLEAILHGPPQDLHLTGIPDARLTADIAFHRSLTFARADRALPPSPKRPANAVFADDLFQLAKQAGFAVHVRWQGDGTSGLLEAAFIDGQPAALPAWPRTAAPLPPISLVNRPYLPHPAAHLLTPILQHHLAPLLPRHLIPSAFVIVGKFPLTPDGQIDRNAMSPLHTTQRPAARRLIPPANATESRLLEIWKQVLGRDDIGISDDIFDLGGDSIHAFQITTRASRAGLAITPAQILQLRTVSAVVSAALSGAATR